MDKLKVTCVFALFLCFAHCSVISSNVTKIGDERISEEELELRMSDYKAGAGFLIICTFLLMGDYGVSVNELQGSRTVPAAFEAELATLKNRMSILDKVEFQQGKAVRTPEEYVDVPPICSSKSGSSVAVQKERVRDSIKRSLQFVSAHIEKLHTLEPAFALSALKAVDDKHGGELQKAFPISDWIHDICGTFHDHRESDACDALTSIWKSRPGNWLPEDIIPTYAAEYESVGNESEVIWGRLNGECQLALLTRCEVPYVCERTLYDPTPRSQYMLTHQFLQRTLSEFATCAASKDLLDPEVNHRLCGKMYKEAELIHGLGTPEVMRDLFAEQIGLCGYMGYSNFLREDWLDSILSWQSSSDYGCFLRDKKVRNRFVTTDRSVKRLATDEEKELGVSVDEDCLPHFTSVSLTALVTYWDYMEENCG